MSVDLLRRAAVTMRERAAAAPPGPWVENVLGSEGYAVMGQRRGTGIGRTWVARCGMEAWEVDKAAAIYIAGMHPLVALALAHWLDTAGADLWAHGPLHCEDGCVECDDDLWMPHVRRAIVVARAYLGEAA